MRPMYNKAVISILIGICCLLCACQANPNSDIVISKNDGSFDANSAITASEDHDPNATEYVDQKDELLSSDGTVKFSIDIGEIITAANMPVIEVTPHKLTENDIKRVAYALFGQAEFYDQEVAFAPKYSKQEIQEKINRWSYYTTPNAISELYGMPNDTYVEIVKGFIEQYTKLYEEAPNENPHELCQWKFRKTSQYNYPKEELINRNISNENDDIIVHIWIDDVEYCFNASTRDKNDFKLNYISVYLDAGISPVNMDERIFRSWLCRTAKPSANQIDAVKSKAEGIIDAMDLGTWVVDQCYVKTTYYGDTPEYIICVNAVPVFNGVSVVRQAQLENLKSAMAYASNYYYSDMKFEYSANGELVRFELYSPVDIQSVVNENVAVKSLDELLELAKRHLQYVEYNAHGLDVPDDTFDEDLVCSVEICSLEYGLSRVKAPNTDESYYYVPAITIKGYVEIYGKESDAVYYRDDHLRTILSLNAVDGTIINTTNG